VTGRSLRAIVTAAALVAAIVGLDMIGRAAASPRRSRLHFAARPLEPGFTGTFLYRNDNFRTGQNLAESILTPATVNASQFGLLFADALDGAAYAQPLYAPNVTLPDQTVHNVVYVATENDSVYAFDADQQGPPLWQTSFINPSAGIVPVPASDLGGCGDLIPIIGITATPVIDPASGTLYVVSKVKLGPGSYQQQLHALDITTGLERPNSPVAITASVPGTGEDQVNGVITFNPLLQHDRPALTLSNGVVYLSFASHCDIAPYHGWILGYDETSLAQVVVYNTTANGGDGGIWQSGCGPGVDTNGDLIAITGNGTFDTSSSRVDYGDSFLRLTPGGGTLSVSTFFTPLNELTLDDDDLDMGSGGNLMLPDQPGPNPHLMVSAGKVGILYLVNRDSMGGFNVSQDQMVQEVSGQITGMFGTPAYWQGNVPNVGLRNMIYTISVGDRPKVFVLSNGMIQTPPVSVSSANYFFGFPGASPVISANGTSGGIMWAINSQSWMAGGPAILYAFDATNLFSDLYDSNQFSADNAGPAVKFAVPTVANGAVYVGTQNQLDVYGLLPNGRSNSSATPTATATATSTSAMTQTPAVTISATPTATSTSAVTSTPTAGVTPTATPTPSSTPSPVFAALEAKPLSISFSSQVIGRTSKTATVTVFNAAAYNSVTMSEPVVSTGFTITSNNCPAVLKPRTTCTIGVASVPSLKGKQTGQLRLNSNAEYGTRAIILKGRGLAPRVKANPKSLSFEPVSPEAVSSSHSVTIVNDTPKPISFTSAPAATPPFNVTANTCGTLAPNGGSCTISVEFAPHSRGRYVGTLELRHTAANSPQQIKLFGKSK
jgi:hypothetical protein